jgi:XRE family aerobic/anaerobic benzoate catabolism transcriptional regulator
VARDICAEFGNRIRQLRLDRGWRQIDLAEQAGISENYVSDLEVGRKEVCLRMIGALASAFDMTTGELLGQI